MRKPTKVQAPEQCQSYLTAGKVYDVVRCDKSASEQYGYGFTILNDMGNKNHCLERKCAHLNYADWIVVQSKSKRQELYLDETHPNYSELTNAGLTERDTCEFYVTNDGKAIAFNFDSIDEFMKYLGKLQGSRVRVELMYGLIGWSYTDLYCIDNTPDGEDWVKFDVLTYADILQDEISLDTTNRKDDLLYCTAELVSFAYNYKKQDVFFRFGDNGLEMCEVERNQMNIDNFYMGIVFNLSDVKS